jgi:hypothetical protein
MSGILFFSFSVSSTFVAHALHPKLPTISRSVPQAMDAAKGLKIDGGIAGESQHTTERLSTELLTNLMV